MSKFTLALDASQISQFLFCPLSWYYQYNERLQLKDISKAAPNKGTLIHSLCNYYYTYRFYNFHSSKIDALNAAINIFVKSEETKKLFPNDKELEAWLINRFSLYVNRYINDDFILPKNEISPIEIGFSKLLYEDANVLFIVNGRLDICQVLLQANLSCWVDHKTQAKTADLYDYTPQFLTYAWATGYEYGLINYIGMQEDDNNKLLKENKLFRRQLITFNAAQIGAWEYKLIKYFFKIANILQAFTENEIEHAFHSHRNENSCGGAFQSHPCQFTYLCEQQNWEMKQKVKQFKYNIKEHWTPYEVKSND